MVFELVVEERVVRLAGERSKIAQRTEVADGELLGGRNRMGPWNLCRRMAYDVSALTLLSCSR